MKRTVGEQMTLIRRALLSARDYSQSNDARTWADVFKELEEALQEPLMSAPWEEIVRGKVTPIKKFRSRLLRGKKGK